MSVIRKRINSVKKKKRDYGTMTYDYDNDIFELGPNIGIPVKAVIVIVKSSEVSSQMKMLFNP